jgi:hypothetical protein
MQRWKVEQRRVLPLSLCVYPQEFFANVCYAAMGISVPNMALYHVNVNVHVDETVTPAPALPTVLPTYIMLAEYLSEEVGGPRFLACSS